MIIMHGEIIMVRSSIFIVIIAIMLVNNNLIILLKNMYVIYVYIIGTKMTINYAIAFFFQRSLV